MSRPARTQPGTGSLKAKGKRQFNAALEEQLVLDFNTAAPPHGRDALLEGLIVSFLEKAKPDSPSLLRFRDNTQKPKTTPTDPADACEVAAEEAKIILEQREAIAKIYELATQIVEIGKGVMLRRPPRRADAAANQRKQISAS